MSPLTGVPTKAPLWRDVRVLKWVFQLVVLAIFVSIIFWLYNNYQVNIQKSKIPTGLEFLDNPANFTMPGNDFNQSSPVWSAFIQGFYNTLRVSIVGILLSIFFGTLIGMARLSKNFLVRTVAGAYVEVIRNLPLLVLLTFMNLAVVLQTFPRIEDAWKPLDLFVVSNRGIAIPWFEGSGTTLLTVLAAALVIAGLVAWLRGKYSDRTGKPARGLLYAHSSVRPGGSGVLVHTGLPVDFALRGRPRNARGTSPRPFVLCPTGHLGHLHQQPHR